MELLKLVYVHAHGTTEALARAKQLEQYVLEPETQPTPESPKPVETEKPKTGKGSQRRVDTSDVLS